MQKRPELISVFGIKAIIDINSCIKVRISFSNIFYTINFNYDFMFLFTIFS